MAPGAPRLKREAGLLQVVTYGVGNIIGAGIYVLVGGAAGLAGAAVWLAFVFGAVVALFTGLSYAELAAMYPKAASEYFYMGKAYGNRLLAFLTEWMMLVTEVVAAAAVSMGFAGYFQSIWALPVPVIAAALLLACTIISVKGIRLALRLNMVLSGIAILGLLIVIFAGAPKVGSADYTFSPTGFSGIVGAAILVFFAYIGFDNIANLSEETKDPQRTLPRGLLISVFLSTILYVLVAVSAVSLVPWQELASSPAPLALAASAAYGPVAFAILTFAALVTTFNTVLVLLIVSSRIIYGIGKEGGIPKILGRVNAFTHTPIYASAAALGVALLCLPLGNIDIVAKITSFGSLLTFALINLALIHLRRAAPNLRRPFRAPFSVGWMPVTGLIGMVSCLALLTQFDGLSLALGLVLPVSGFIMYFSMHREPMLAVDSRLHQRHETR